MTENIMRKSIFQAINNAHSKIEEIESPYTRIVLTEILYVLRCLSDDYHIPKSEVNKQ